MHIMYTMPVLGNSIKTVFRKKLLMPKQIYLKPSQFL